MSSYQVSYLRSEIEFSILILDYVYLSPPTEAFAAPPHG